MVFSIEHCNTLWYIAVFFQNSVEGRIVVVDPLGVRVVELVSDQLAVDLDPQIAGEGNSEEKPQPIGRILMSTVETFIEYDHLM